MRFPKPDAFGTVYDNSGPHITLENGRVFQVPLRDEDGNMLFDENGFLAVDIDATFQAHHDWLALHPEEIAGGEDES